MRTERSIQTENALKRRNSQGVRRCALLLTLALPLGCTLEDEVLGDDMAAFDTGEDDADADTGEEDDGTRVFAQGEPNDCDMSGRWIAELKTESTALGTLRAIAYNWYYYEIEDNGDDIVVTRGWDCAFEVTNATVVNLLPATRLALAQLNRQDGTINAISDPPVEVDPRRGVYRPDPDNPGECEFAMERWWWLRGVESRFAPPRESYGDFEISDAEEFISLPTTDAPDGEWDIENDGKPGIWLEVTAPLSGQRHTVQRDWNQYGPFSIPDGAEDFLGPADFDNQENAFDASTSLLLLGSVPRTDGHTIRFRRVDETAPTDIEAFVDWCRTNVEDVFKEAR